MTAEGQILDNEIVVCETTCSGGNDQPGEQGDAYMSNATPYAVVSADCHAGADVQTYRHYLESRWYDEFDEWAQGFVDPWARIESEDFEVGVSSGASPLNWSTPRRQAHLEEDGICAEVLFPNTAPPFFPTGVLAASIPHDRDEYERRMAGIRAHNRWLVDFCNELPGRRAGVAQVFLNDIDDAIDEIRWISGAGLKGGVLLPADTQQQLVPLYYPRYDPVWQVCEELGVPVHRHASIPGEIPGEDSGPGARAIGLVESRFFAHRALAHLVFAGVFDRFPGLRLIFTESGTGWVPDQLAALDGMARAGRVEGSIAEHFVGEASRRMKHLPSEYFATNCYIGSSFITADEVALRDRIGIDRIMWGSDYPHSEGTYPYSREALRAAFATVDPSETRRMISANAATVFGFDLDQLNEVARQIGAPTPDEVATPLLEFPSFPDETVSPALVGAAVTGHAHRA